MPSTSVTITTEPINIAHSAQLNLTAGTEYTLQYIGQTFAYITSATNVAGATPSTASVLTPNDWVKVTPTAGEGVYVWAQAGGGAGGGVMVLHSNIEPLAR